MKKEIKRKGTPVIINRKKYRSISYAARCLEYESRNTLYRIIAEKGKIVDGVMKLTIK